MRSRSGLSNTELALRICNTLKYVNYYRLADYWYNARISITPEKKARTFMPGTYWEDVCDLYHFDRKLRLLLFEAVSIIEIALREAIIELLVRQNRSCINPQFIIRHFERRFRKIRRRPASKSSSMEDVLVAGEVTVPYLPSPMQEKYGSSLIDSNSLFGDFVSKVQKLYDTSQTESALYYRNKLRITKVQFLPIWVFMEHVTFGALNTLVSRGLRKKYVDELAQEFGFSSTPLFTSSVTLLHQVRNQCAHQNRVWNRLWGRVEKNHIFTPILKVGVYRDLANIYPGPLPTSPTGTAAVIAICRVMLDKIYPDNRWYERIQALLHACPLPNIASKMGY